MCVTSRKVREGDYEEERRAKRARLGLPPPEEWSELPTDEFERVFNAPNASESRADINDYFASVEKAKKLRKYEAAVNAAKKRQLHPRFRRAEYNLKKECHAIGDVEYEGPSPTETANQSQTRRRKIRCHIKRKVLLYYYYWQMEIKQLSQGANMSRFHRQEHKGPTQTGSFRFVSLNNNLPRSCFVIRDRTMSQEARQCKR